MYIDIATRVKRRFKLVYNPYEITTARRTEIKMKIHKRCVKSTAALTPYLYGPCYEDCWDFISVYKEELVNVCSFGLEHV